MAELLWLNRGRSQVRAEFVAAEAEKFQGAVGASIAAFSHSLFVSLLLVVAPVSVANG